MLNFTEDELRALFGNKIYKAREYVTFTPFEDVDEGRFASDIPISAGIDIENVIFRLSDIKVVEVLVLKSLGFTPLEISETLGYDSVGSYYQLNFKLKRDFEKLQNE